MDGQLKKTGFFIVLIACLSLHSEVLAAADEDAKIWCKSGNGTVCSEHELNNPIEYKQVLIFPTGFAADEYELFRDEVDRMIFNMDVNSNLYSHTYLSKLLYIGYWLPGPALDSGEANFGAKISVHPIRNKALTLNQDAVIATVDAIKESVTPWLAPWGVMVLYNSRESQVTANASPPSFIMNSYGIAKINRKNIDGPYVAIHELAHAALNFVDEYTERGLENVNINVLNYLTSQAYFDKSWGGFRLGIASILGIYDLKISEILAANGSGHVDVTKYPSRVESPRREKEYYAYQGGMFFGKGTYHHAGRNIMNGNRGSDAPDDGYSLAHNDSQLEIVRQVFENGGVPFRPNDRIRNAGPHGNWPSAIGGATNVMVFDADKNNHYQPTKSYDIQIGWYERHWKVCKWKFVRYPCYKSVWTTAEKQVKSAVRAIDLKETQLYGFAKLVRDVLCDLGVMEIPNGNGKVKLCEMTVDEMTDAFVPTLQFPSPYQEVSVPASQWMTKYFYRFRTDNGTFKSGWTGWSTFIRTL